MANPYAPPKTPLETSPPSGDPLPTLPRLSIWYVLGLTIITVGIYLLFLAYQRTQQLNALLAPEQRISGFFVAICLGLLLINYPSAFLTEFYPLDQGMVLLDGAINLSATVFSLIWAFRFRERLQRWVHAQQQPLHCSAFLTFFLQFIYLQYKINKIKDMTSTAIYAA